ncbi:hypothetical protein O181_126136, partial [Austropuccinia psidii MF-1]|nr:hypothetical protein [Austropuccinia psidii MF-1]
MLFVLKASRWTKKNSSKFLIGHLQETSRLFNHSLALPAFTTVSSRIIQIKSVHSPVSSRKIPFSPSIRKLLVSSPTQRGFQHRSNPFPLQSFSTHHSYCPGCLTTLLDALSSRDNVYRERGEDFNSKNPLNLQQLINKDEVQPSTYFALKVESFPNLIDSIQKALWQYFQYRSMLEELGKGKSVQDYSLDSSSQLLLFKDRVVVPNYPTVQLSILQKCQDSPLAGHPGQEKTLKLVKQDFRWSGMTQLIKDYVSSCQQCSRNKNIHNKNFGFLKPLPIPNVPCLCLSLDFITQLPLSNSFDSILVIVERFSKMAFFIPTMPSITSLDLAYLFIKNIFSKNGLPSSIVSDRGSLFVSSFWTNL